MVSGNQLALVVHVYVVTLDEALQNRNRFGVPLHFVAVQPVDQYRLPSVVDVETDLQVKPRIDHWIFRYRSFRNGKLAECNPMKRTIAIKKRLEGDDLKSALVHEMIHAFESMMTMAYRDWLLAAC